jgi:hypothetical protein
MRDPQDAWQVLFVLLLALALVFLTRSAALARTRGWTHTRIPIGRQLVATVLVSIAVGTSLITPSPAWAPALTFVCFTYGLLVAYQVTVHMFDGRQVSLVRTYSFWVITAVIGIVLLLDGLRGGNHGSFIEGDPFTPTRNYVTSYTLALGTLLYLHLRIVGVHWRSMRTHLPLTSAVGITYTLRRSTAMAAFILGAVNLIILELQLLAAWSGVRSPLLDRVFALNTFTAPTALALLLASVSFHWVYTRIAHGIQYGYTRQRRQTAALLTYLQRKMLEAVPTVPHVEVADPPLHWERALAEIADAREVLWSDAPRTTPITPDEEARRVFEVVRKQRSLRIGPYLHPPIDDTALVAHNVAVAQALQRLEQHLAPAEQEHDA